MQLVITPSILRAVEAYNEQASDPIDVAGVEFIEHAVLFKIANELLQTTAMEEYSFKNLLKGSRFYAPPKKVFEPTPEYVRAMENARLIVAQKEYDELKKKGSGSLMTEAQEWKLVNKQMTAIFNVFVSIFAVFAAVFYLGEMAHMDIGLRVLYALIGGFIVAFAEGWFFTKDLFATEKNTVN